MLKQENVECLKQANRVVKKAKKEKCQINIPDLGNLEQLKIVAYSDAPFGNLPDGCSQGGYILFFGWKQRPVYAHCLPIQAY